MICSYVQIHRSYNFEYLGEYIGAWKWWPLWLEMCATINGFCDLLPRFIHVNI